MRFGRVTGNVISTIKHEKLKSIKLMIVEPLDSDGKVIGREEIVGDFLNAAIGSLVIWGADGHIISHEMGVENIPLRGSIIGIIDKIDMEKLKKVIKG
jgi:microcompartment protein CcmK/EutM